MDIRKCVYTGLTAKCKDSLIPKNILGNEIHNWTSEVPCNIFYKEIKKEREPNELELMALEYFYLLEVAKIKVKYYEGKLREVQEKIGFKEPTPEDLFKKNENKVDRQIREAKVLNSNMEDANQAIDQFFKNKKDIF